MSWNTQRPSIKYWNQLPSSVISGVADVHLTKTGENVGASQVTLLGMLGLSTAWPCWNVYEAGALYDSAILNITNEDMLGAVPAAIANVAALCFATGFPTLASTPTSVINAYKNVLAIALATDHFFPLWLTRYECL
jgi:large subunit ribosomal protein LP0